MLLTNLSKRSLLLINKRTSSYYSTTTISTTVPLSFVKYDTYKTQKPFLSSDIIMKEKQQKPPLIICHGLFGSKQNWRSLAKSLSVKCQCPVYTIDARNHGESPHIDTHTYELMANDVLQFIRDEGLNHPVLMGHSMGGKVMMELTLRNPTLPSKLVVIDISPIRFELSGEHHVHIQAMREINAAQFVKQKDADLLLQKYEPDLLIRQFLLTNLKKNLNKGGIYEFRIPYEILGHHLHHMGDFLQDKLKYEGETLFVTGGKSPYRKQFLKYPELIHQQFPNSVIENIEEAGHWVQTEQPDAFLSIVSKFINKK